MIVQQGLVPLGEYPAVLGHEGAGVVRRVGSNVTDKSLQEGDLVFLSFISCHGDTCRPCSEGRNGFCDQITPINFAGARGLHAESPISLPGRKAQVRGQFFGQSSMSKLAVVDERSIVRPPPGSGIRVEDMAVLAPLGCGYLTGAGTVFNVLKPNTGSKLVILGMGAVGFAALLAARSQGVETIVAVDLVNMKLELAKSLGASHVLNTKGVSDIADKLLGMSPGGFDCVLDTTGVVPLLEAGVNILGREGILAIVGVAPPNSSMKIDPLKLMIGCQRIVGVMDGFCNPVEVSHAL